MDTGSRQENASNQESRAPFRFNRNGKGSRERRFGEDEMNFKWFGPIALLAAIYVGDQIRINRPGHKYRLTVEVETPAGRKSASGVMAVHPDRSYSRGGHTKTVGDAV